MDPANTKGIYEPGRRKVYIPCPLPECVWRSQQGDDLYVLYPASLVQNNLGLYDLYDYDHGSVVYGLRIADAQA